jgi:hypothetical protein
VAPLGVSSFFVGAWSCLAWLGCLLPFSIRHLLEALNTITGEMECEWYCINLADLSKNNHFKVKVFSVLPAHDAADGLECP